MPFWQIAILATIIIVVAKPAVAAGGSPLPPTCVFHARHGSPLADVLTRPTMKCADVSFIMRSRVAGRCIGMAPAATGVTVSWQPSRAGATSCPCGHQLHVAVYTGTGFVADGDATLNGAECTDEHFRQTAEAKGVTGSEATWTLYDVWHAYASTAVREQTSGVVLSVEQILQSNGGKTLSDVYSNPGAAAQFYYHTTPQLGPYCLYRQRPGQTGVLPDCPNITHVTTRHAHLLNDLGIDTAIVDGTNLGTFNSFSDALQLRPMEVLAEEWFEMRKKGHPTPSIAAWNCLPTGSNLWQYYLDNIYNNANLSTLVAKDPASGKMIFFVPNNPGIPPDAGILASVQSNGGRNNVITVGMWANLSPSQFVADQIWTFMAPCTGSAGGYTTSTADLSACNQLLLPASPLGSYMSVSPSYQLGYGSLPFQGAGKDTTWTLQLQFATAIASGPTNLLLSSFNEFLAQPQSNPYPQQVASMGLTWDPMQRSLWVDTFGGSLARDIEPSNEFGAVIYETAKSCMRTMSMIWASVEEQQQSSGNSTVRRPIKQSPLEASTRPGAQLRALCDAVPALRGEACCVTDPTRQNVWSLRTNGDTDFLLTINPEEKDILVNSGGWTEVCNAFGGPTAFCVDTTLTNGIYLGSGPFLLSRSANPSGWTGPGVELFRCRTTGGTHFFSNDPNCEGQVTEFSMGYAATNRSSEFPRELRRCYDESQNGIHYHSLDLPCPRGVQETVYGYVH